MERERDMEKEVNVEREACDGQREL